MEKRIKVKMRGVEVEKLMEDTSNKNIRIKWCKYLWNEPAELYDDSKIYEYELMFRCSEWTTTKEIKDYIDSFKWIEPKNKKEYIAQIHVYETVHWLYNTNTKNFSLQELKEHFKNIKKKTIWEDTSKKTWKNTYEVWWEKYWIAIKFIVNLENEEIIKIWIKETIKKKLSKKLLKELIYSYRNFKEVLDLFDNFINNETK